MIVRKNGAFSSAITGAFTGAADLVWSGQRRTGGGREAHGRRTGGAREADGTVFFPIVKNRVFERVFKNDCKNTGEKNPSDLPGGGGAGFFS